MIISNKQEKYTVFKITQNLIELKDVIRIKEIVLKAKDNVIMDFSEVEDCSEEVLNKLQEIYELQTDAKHSFIISNLTDELWDKTEDLGIELNITPTLDEGVDILFMEEIEREL